MRGGAVSPENRGLHAEGQASRQSSPRSYEDTSVFGSTSYVYLNGIRSDTRFDTRSGFRA